MVHSRTPLSVTWAKLLSSLRLSSSVAWGPCASLSGFVGTHMGSQSWWEGQQQPHPCAQGPESRRHPQPLSFSCCRHQLRRPQGQAAVPPRASQGRWTPNYKHGVRKRKPSDRSSENGVSRDESFTIRILFYGLNLLPNLKVSVRDAGKGRGGGGGRRSKTDPGSAHAPSLDTGAMAETTSRWRRREGRERSMGPCRALPTPPPARSGSHSRSVLPASLLEPGFWSLHARK